MLLEAYAKKFECALKMEILRFGAKSRLRDACEYALMCGGKRLRPLIVLMTADALGKNLDVLPSAFGVEFFHTASLIADDLPCMDNDAMRRGKLSLHKAFGEAEAVLASYTLIAEGYGAIHRNCEAMRASPFSKEAEGVALFCLEVATRSAGMSGATQGQFLDLFPPDATWETMELVILQKTAALFEVSFVFGWLFGGGSSASLEAVRKASRHLGMAFQIADDLEDGDQDGARGVNALTILGRQGALALFEREFILFQKALKGLGLWTYPFQELGEKLRRACSLC